MRKRRSAVRYEKAFGMNANYKIPNKRVRRLGFLRLPRDSNSRSGKQNNSTAERLSTQHYRFPNHAGNTSERFLGRIAKFLHARLQEFCMGTLTTLCSRPSEKGLERQHH